MVAILDLETDSLDYTRCWAVGVYDTVAKKYTVYQNPGRIRSERNRLAESLKDQSQVVMHNGLGFDLHVLKDLLEIEVPIDKVFDTMVVSRLLDYRKLRDHKLETWGDHLKFSKLPKVDFSQGCTPELLKYLEQDVMLTHRVYLSLVSYINSNGGIDTWRSSLQLERTVEFKLRQFTKDGFYIDTAKANFLREELKSKCSDLEKGFQDDFPPQLLPVHKVKYRTTKGGMEFATVTNAKEKYPKTEVQGDDLICYDYVSFNPGSSKDRINVLNAAGWKPYEKTKTHIEWDRDRDRDESKRQQWQTYGWTCSEANLETLPDTAPEGARKLAEWLSLDARAKDLEEWLACVGPDERVHGAFVGIGSWTHRLAHRKPNQANIFAPYLGSVVTAVEKVKAEYDHQLRALWCVPPGSYMVGTDAEGIQLRLLCHITQSEQYREALLSGKKENQTDIHNLNRKALGLEHITRDDAKTF